MSTRLSFKQIEQIAASWGLEITGVSPADALYAEESRLQRWQQAGFAGGMKYMERDSSLFVTPDRLLTGAVSVLSFAVQYDQGANDEHVRPGFGRIARYARGRDYHRVLKRLVRKCMEELFAVHAGAFSWRAFTDAVPLLERALARTSDLGFIGKNTMLIRPGEGSFFFLAEVIIDAEVEEPPEKAVRGKCGSCTRCLQACPTAAFAGPYHLDARRCISYLTIEKRGRLSAWERDALGEWVFGCDVCQEVCPFNYTVLKKEASNALKDFAPRGYVINGCIDLAAVLSIRTDEQYLEQFAGTPLMRAGREGLLRNACCVAANTAATNLEPALTEMLTGEENALLRETAVYALSKLRTSCDTAGARRIERSLELARLDTDKGVRHAVVHARSFE